MTPPVKQKKIVIAPAKDRSIEATIVAVLHTCMTVIILVTTAYLANS